MKSNVIGWIFFVIIILVVVGILIKNWGWISSSFSSKKCKESDTPFECVKRQGGKKGIFIEANPGFSDMYDYPDSQSGSYRFYANGKVIILSSSPLISGQYNKERITWNDGNSELIADVFKNK